MINLKDNTILKKIVFLIAVVACAVSLGLYVGSKRSSKTTPTSQEIEKLAKPVAEAKLGQSFDFSIEELEDNAILKFTLVGAKKVKAVANQGQPIKAGSGEEFLIISLEYGNDSAFSLKVNSRDFVRLLGDEGKKFAPDFYNEAIDVSPVSVRKDEIGFVVAAGKKQFKLLVGQKQEEETTEVEINF